jgi:hypothetical protein
MLELHTTSPVGTDKDNKSFGKRVCITNGRLVKELA